MLGVKLKDIMVKASTRIPVERGERDYLLSSPNAVALLLIITTTYSVITIYHAYSNSYKKKKKKERKGNDICTQTLISC